MKRLAPKQLVALAAGSLMLLLATAAALAATGALTQPAGKAGCVSADGSGRCADGHGLAGGVDAVAVSPDSESVYVTTRSAVARFKRHRATGALTQPVG